MNLLFSQRHLIAFGLCLQLLGLPGQAQEVRQHAGHEHGSARLNMAITDHQIHVEFLSPAINIVGFEQQPRTEQQAAPIAAAVKTFKQDKLFVFPAAAGCALREALVETGLMPVVQESGDQEHEEHDEVMHDDEHGDPHDDESVVHDEHSTESGDAGTHSEFTATYLYECEDSGELRFIDVVVFDRFPGNREIHAQIVDPTRQMRKTLTPDANRIELEH